MDSVWTVNGQTWQWSEFGYGRCMDRSGSGRNLGTEGVWTDVAVVGIWALSLYERVNKNKEILSHDRFKPGALGDNATAVTYVFGTENCVAWIL